MGENNGKSLDSLKNHPKDKSNKGANELNKDNADGDTRLSDPLSADSDREGDGNADNGHENDTANGLGSPVGKDSSDA